jgi:hypothetical protein
MGVVMSRVLWPAVLVVSLTVGACGGSTSEDADAGASGGAATGGSAPESMGGSGGGGAGALGDCNPLSDTCPEGKYCQVLEGRTECIDEGSTERDELCEETDTCQRGSICLGAGEYSGKLCQQPCTLDAEPWTVCDIGRHTCFVAVDDDGNELPFGVCRY